MVQLSLVSCCCYVLVSWLPAGAVVLGNSPVPCDPICHSPGSGSSPGTVMSVVVLVIVSVRVVVVVSKMKKMTSCGAVVDL